MRISRNGKNEHKMKNEMKVLHNTYPISRREGLKTIGVMVRKWNITDNGDKQNLSEKNLNKQIRTLHKKMKKDNLVYTEYSIERDSYCNGYHIHLIIHHKDTDKVNQMLYKFIGGKECSIREIGLNTFNDFSGVYGHVMTEHIMNENQFRRYINKRNQSTTLI
jgi:hypothetical protein